MKETRNSFSKHERLTGTIAIESLFNSGKSFFVYPFLILYRFSENESGSRKVLISVSKKKFKLAVDRNRIKRQIRESYRLQKREFLEKLKCGSVDVALVYVGREAIDYQKLDGKLKSALQTLSNKLNA